MRSVRTILLALLFLPLAAATPATEPYAWSATMDADPAVGATVTLTVRVQALRALDAPLKLDVPEWVSIEEPLEWHAQVAEGERGERAWRVTPTRSGFWRVGLAADTARAEAYAEPVDPARAWQAIGGCCLHAWSTEDRGLFSERPEGAVPGESTVGFHPSFRAIDAERAELVVRVSPQDKRYVGQELLFQAPAGSADMQTAPADAPHEFAHPFLLADGASAVVSAAAYVRVTFEAGEHAQAPATWSQHVACANFQVERIGDEVREVGRSGCAAASSRPRAIPGAAWTWIATCAFLAAAFRRR